MSHNAVCTKCGFTEPCQNEYCTRNADHAADCGSCVEATCNAFTRFAEQYQFAAQQCGDDANRTEAEAVTLEWRAPLQAEGMGAKPATKEQPGLFCEQQTLF